MAAAEWVMVRIRRSTRDKLSTVIDTMTEALEQGKITVPYRHDVLVTLDDAILRLIDLNERKRERVKESRERAKAAKAAIDADPPSDDD